MLRFWSTKLQNNLNLIKLSLLFSDKSIKIILLYNVITKSSCAILLICRQEIFQGQKVTKTCAN